MKKIKEFEYDEINSIDEILSSRKDREKSRDKQRRKAREGKQFVRSFENIGDD